MKRINPLIKEIRTRDREIGIEANNAFVQQNLDEVLNTESESPHDKSVLMGFVAFRSYEAFSNFSSSIRLAKKALELDPKNSRALIVVAMGAFFDGDIETYKEYLDRGLAVVPDSKLLLTAATSLSLASGSSSLIDKYLNSPNIEDEEVLPDINKAVDEFNREVPDQLVSDKRFVMLSGVSHCGSTFLGNFLAAHQGVEYLGESHRLILHASEDHRTTYDASVKFIPCHLCGPQECERFTDDFRTDLRSDPSHFYLKILQRCPVPVVISGDKNFPITRKLAPKADFHEIVLFKRPENAYQSHYKRLEITPDSESQPSDVNKYLKIYSNNYANLLLYKSGKNKRIFLNWESFIERPEIHLPMLSEVVQVDLNSKLLGQFSNQRHSFGGNKGVNDNLKKGDSNLKNQVATELPEERMAEVQSNDTSNKVFERMLNRYNAAFE